MAGQSVGMVTREQPTREILDELVAQAVDALMARDRAREQHLREDERRQAGG
jgi:hypothetical protein